MHFSQDSFASGIPICKIHVAANLSHAVLSSFNVSRFYFLILFVYLFIFVVFHPKEK